MTLDALLLILTANADGSALVPDGAFRPREGHLGANDVLYESEKPASWSLNTVIGSHSAANVDFRSGQSLKLQDEAPQIDRRDAARNNPQ